MWICLMGALQAQWVCWPVCSLSECLLSPSPCRLTSPPARECCSSWLWLCATVAFSWPASSRLDMWVNPRSSILIDYILPALVACYNSSRVFVHFLSLFFCLSEHFIYLCTLHFSNLFALYVLCLHYVYHLCTICIFLCALLSCCCMHHNFSLGTIKLILILRMWVWSCLTTCRVFYSKYTWGEV